MIDPATTMGVIIIIYGLLFLGIILTIWALIDSLISKFETETTKIIWIIVLIFVPFGFLFYYFIGRKQKIKNISKTEV